MTRRTRRNEVTETGPSTVPDAPPAEAAGARDVRRRPADDDRSLPPMTGSEATSTVAHGTARETGQADERAGDAVDGSEGSATGSRTSGASDR